jgi:hypothetical protein
MKKFLSYLIPFLLCFFENAMADSPRDVQEIYQITIDMRILEKYFHAETLPERKPLLILKNEHTEPEPPLVKFGVPVQYVSRDELKEKSRPYLEFSTVVISEDRAHVEFLYPPEGLAGKVDLFKDARGWHITRHSTVER